MTRTAETTTIPAGPLPGIDFTPAEIGADNWLAMLDVIAVCLSDLYDVVGAAFVYAAERGATITVEAPSSRSVRIRVANPKAAGSPLFFLTVGQRSKKLLRSSVITGGGELGRPNSQETTDALSAARLLYGWF
jgi:hypothetical protein